MISFAILLRVLLLNYYPDFSVHYYSFELMMNNKNPYLAKYAMFVPHAYPPFVILLFSPFYIVPFLIAQKIWTILSIIFLYLSIHLMFKLNNRKIFSTLGFLILGFSFLYFPVKFTLGMGQINNLILFLTILGVYLFNENRLIMSGLSLGLSIVIKFFPMIFIPYFFIIQKKRLAIYTFIFFLFFTVLGIIFTNLNIGLFFYEEILPTLLNSWKADYYNQSFSGFIARITNDIGAKNILRTLSTLFFILSSFIPILKTVKKTKDRINLELSLLVITTLIVNNFSWQHHFTLLLFPLITIFLHIEKQKLSLRHYLILGFCYLLTTLNFKVPNSYPIILQSHVLYGAIILWLLNLKLLFNK